MTTPFISTLAVDDAHTADIYAVSSCDKYTISGSGDGNILLWDNNESSPEPTSLNREPIKAGIHHLAVDDAGTRLLAVSFDGKVLIWDLREHRSLEFEATKDIRGAWACSVAAKAGPLGLIGAISSLSGTVYLLNLETGELLQQLELPQSAAVSPCTCIDISPDGTYVAAGFDSGKIRVWSAETGRVAYTLPAPTSAPRSVKFSPLGTLIGVAGESTVALFTLNGGSFIGTLEGHEAWVYAIDWSPTGEQLLSVAHDGSAKIWNMETREVSLSLADAQGPLFSGTWLRGPLPVLAGSRAGVVMGGADRALRWYREASGSQ